MELGLGTTLLAGDPRLIDHIVGEVKSQGIFDQFRKECIADVDTKPAYQNLRTRVEGSVNSFLNKQIWRPDLNKNQLRETLRKHISDAPYLDAGVERIVDQVVNPKVFSVFMPQIEDVVYKFLGMERPKNRDRDRNGPCNLKDLLPKDLDPVSPESDKNSLKDISLESVDADIHAGEERKSATPEAPMTEKEPPRGSAEEPEDGPRMEDVATPAKEEEDKRRTSETGEELEEDQKQMNVSINSTKSEDKEEEEEDSPTFEPIDIINPNESNDSHLSGISELTSHGSRSPNFCANDFSRDNFDFSNQDSRLSKVSSDSRLSIVTDFGSSNHASTPILEDSSKSESRNAKEHFKAIREESSKSKSSAKSFELEKSGNGKLGEAKTPRSNHPSKENSRSATDGSISGKDKKESSKSRDSRSKESKSREKSGSSSSGKHSRSSKSRRSDGERSRSDSKGERTSKVVDTKPPPEAGASTSATKQEEEKQPKDLKDIYKEKIRELREKKELTEKEKLKDKDKDKDKDKEKSSKDRKESTSKDRKSGREKDHRSSSSSSKSSRQEKSKSESGSGTKDSSSRSRSKEHHRSSSSSSKKPREESKKESSKSASSSSSSSSSDKLKKDSKKERSSSETGSGKDKKRHDEKKSSKSSKDDHSSLRKNSSDRRSTDRDGSNGSNSKNGSHVNHGNNNSTGSNNNSNNTGNSSNNNNTSTDKNGSSNKESNSNSGEENTENLQLEANKLPTENIGYVQELLSRPEHVELGGLEMTLPLKKRPFNTDLEPEMPVKRSKFTKNLNDAKNLVKIREQLERDLTKDVEVSDRDIEDEVLEKSSNPKDQLEAVLDEERVQIIEVPDEDYEEPYPEMNLNLEDASVIFSSENVVSDKKLVTKLTVMENAIRQSLSEMISDANLSNSGGSDRLEIDESPETGIKVEEKPLESQTEVNSRVEEIQEKAEVEEIQEKAEIEEIMEKPAIEEIQEKVQVEETEGKILEALLQLPKEEDEEKEKETEDWTSNPDEAAGHLEKDTDWMEPEAGVSELEAPVSDEEDCLYLKEDTERLERFESFLSSLRTEESSRESLEEILESFGGEVIKRGRSSMAAPALPMKRKSTSSPLSDILLNNRNNNNNDGPKAMEVQETDAEDDQNGVSKRKRVGRPKKQLQLQPLRPASLPQALFNGENFVMPLSPESDVSATSEKAALQPLRDDRRQRNNQRYSSDDLYKPRPLFLGSTRRNRKSNQA